MAENIVVDSNTNLEAYDIIFINTSELDLLLRKWELAHLKPYLERGGFDDISDFKTITELELNLIFPLTSDAAYKSRIRSKIIEWRKENGYNINVELLSTTTTTQSLNSSVVDWIQLQAEVSKNQEIPNLATFLKTQKGQKILKIYEASNPPELTEPARKLLIDGLLEFFYTNDVQMKHTDFFKISTDIATTFHNELKNTYYNTEGDRPTGRLYNRYRNELAKLRQIGYTKPVKRNLSKSTEEQNTIVLDSDASLVEDKNWLQVLSEPWATVEAKFKNSYALRRIEFNQVHTNWLEHWPIYKNPDAFRLIDIDFELGHPGQELALYNKWDSFEVTIIPIFLKKFKKDKRITHMLENLPTDKDFKTIDIIKILHYFLKPTGRYVRKLDKKIWKISTQDSIDAFFIELASINDLQNQIIRKRNTCIEYNLTLQPTIIILKGDPTIQKKFSVCLDDIFYSFDSFLNCLNTAFKIHFSLNLNYSGQCYRIWLFIQKYFFEIDTISDKTDPEVEALISQLKNY